MILRACARLRRDIRPVARHRRQHVLRHAPHALRPRQHGAADIRLALGEDVDERLAVDRQRHGAAHIGIVERRLVAVDDQVGRDVQRRR
jgi:hypothetical protein